MADIRAAVQALTARVQSQKTVIDSVAALVQGLRDQLKTVQGDLDSAGESEAASALAALDAALAANTDALAKATAANTDASDEVHAAGM